MISRPWQATFITTIQNPDIGDALKQAALSGELRLWTETLTQAVVVACRATGWQASAKGYPIPDIPVNTKEFLSLDVTAFEPSAKQWPLPIAIMELENQESRIPYSLWKVLCVRAQLRVVFGYSRTTEERASIIKTLQSTVLFDVGIARLMEIEGETLVVIGSRDQAEQFPYGYFKWWQLDNRAGSFSIL